MMFKMILSRDQVCIGDKKNAFLFDMYRIENREWACEEKEDCVYMIGDYYCSMISLTDYFESGSGKMIMKPCVIWWKELIPYGDRKEDMEVN